MRGLLHRGSSLTQERGAPEAERWLTLGAAEGAAGPCVLSAGSPPAWVPPSGPLPATVPHFPAEESVDGQGQPGPRPRIDCLPSMSSSPALRHRQAPSARLARPPLPPRSLHPAGFSAGAAGPLVSGTRVLRVHLTRGSLVPVTVSTLRGPGQPCPLQYKASSC